MIPMTNPAYVRFAGADVERRLRELAGVGVLRVGDFPVERDSIDRAPTWDGTRTCDCTSARSTSSYTR